MGELEALPYQWIEPCAKICIIGTISCRLILLRKRPTILKLLCALAVLVGLFFSLIPVFSGLDQDSKEGNREYLKQSRRSQILWPLCFMFGFVSAYAGMLARTSACRHVSTDQCVQACQHGPVRAGMSARTSACRHVSTDQCVQACQHGPVRAGMSARTSACRHVSMDQCVQACQHGPVRAGMSAWTSACRHVSTDQCVQAWRNLLSVELGLSNI